MVLQDTLGLQRGAKLLLTRLTDYPHCAAKTENLNLERDAR
jgi:hypothetical protein